jgi:hypothetical protein
LWRRRDIKWVPTTGFALRAHASHGGIDHHLAQRCPVRFFATLKLFFQCATDDAGISGLSVAYLARLVDLIAAQTKVSHRDDRVVVANTVWSIGMRFNVGVANLEIPTATMSGDFTARLRRIILIRQPPLGSRLDFQRISLRAMCRCDKIVMRGFGPA